LPSLLLFFDYNPKLSDAMKPDSWEKCMNGVDELLDLLEEQGDNITSGEHILEESEQLDVPPFKVRGCFLTAVESLVEEFVKVLKGCNAHRRLTNWSKREGLLV
jgi:translation initiation factor 3 subunit C